MIYNNYMEIIGLSGKSGTGKSYHASELCSTNGIRGLIDDGLFICDGNIVAGVSAKKQSTSMAAIKTALFTDEAHCIEVSEAIKRSGIDKILVIGTSDKMISLICERLGIGQPSEFIYIEDITTARDREKARAFRDEGGMHVIPAPTLQVKKQFSGYFLDPRKSFGKGKAFEKTIVRPTYSYLGDYIISDKVISDIVSYHAENSPGISDVLWTSFANDPDGCVIRTVVLMKSHASFKTDAEEFQRRIYESVSQMTAFNVRGVEIQIRGYR